MKSKFENTTRGFIALSLLLAVLFFKYAKDRPQIIEPTAQSGGDAPHAVVGSTLLPTGKTAGKYEILRTANHQPIEFYGRVLDQNELPVSEAIVKGQIIYNSGLSSGVEYANVATDLKGRFEIKGYMGRTLDFNIQKAGYIFTPEGDAFDFTMLIQDSKRYHPDPANPTILRMWKIEGPEPIVHGGKFIAIIPDGKTVGLNLRTKKVAMEGDLLISLEYQLQSPPSSLKYPYDWKLEITAVDGGLIEVNRRIEFMMFAPKEGYAPKFRYEMPITKSDWSKNFTKNFYVKTNGDRYSKMVVNVECSPTEPTGYLQITWWMNPSGSQNLEFDEKLAIEPK